MTLRTAATFGGAAVMAAVLAPPLLLRDRLPDPVAIHWGPGLTPDNAVSFPAFLALQAALWAFFWVGLLGWARHAPASRAGRVGWWALAAGGAPFAVLVSAVTVQANLDAPTWADARLGPLSVAVMIAVPLATAALAGYWGRGEPDPVPEDREIPVMRLRRGQRAVWVSRVSNPWLLLISAAAAALLFVLCMLQVTGFVRGPVLASTVPGLVIVLVVGLGFSSLTARVTEDGVRLAFGLLGWPVRRIGLDRIQRAYVEERLPSQVGGWGVRGLPGSSTIMLRGGDCLIL